MRIRSILTTSILIDSHPAIGARKPDTTSTIIHRTALIDYRRPIREPVHVCLRPRSPRAVRRAQDSVR